MDVFIRPVQEGDAASIVNLLNPIIEEGRYTAMAETFSAQDQVDFIRTFPERGIYHAAVEHKSGRLLGIQDVMPHSPGSAVFRHVGEISTFVSLDAHGRGIGRHLSEATFQRAGELGYLKISATVRADNPQAVAFYLGIGFRVIGTAERHAFLGGRYVDEIYLEKFLSD